MKALILAGGTGSRLRPITFSMAKQLVPVANKPVIEFGIEAIAAAGIKDFGIITGDTGPMVAGAVGSGERWGIKITYISQDEPLGLAHAVKTARDYLGDSDFIMYLGDNLIKSGVQELVEEFQANKPAATILLTPVPNPSDFGVAEMKDGVVLRLEEKPKQPKSNLALVGVYLFDSRIHESIDRLKPSFRGEYEITDAIQGLIDRGLPVRSHVIEGWWKDTGTVDAMLEANRLILDAQEPDMAAEVDAESSVEGRVRIGSGTRIINSIVRGPVIIGNDCVIQDSFVGPYTSIDSRTKIIHSEVEHSIILADCHLEHLPHRISNSLLGKGVSVRSTSMRPKTMGLVLGDSSAVTLP